MFALPSQTLPIPYLTKSPLFLSLSIFAFIVAFAHKPRKRFGLQSFSVFPMLARLLSKPSHFRLLSNLSSKPLPFPKPNPLLLKPFSTDSNNNNNKSKLWNLSEEPNSTFDSLFGPDSQAAAGKEESWLDEDTSTGGEVLGCREVGMRGEQEWLAQPWMLEEEEEKKDELFDIGVNDVDKSGDDGVSESEEIKRREEEHKLLLKEEEDLSAVLKGPNRAFGDLIAASGITDEMLDSLIALKDFEEVDGLPPLRDIEDMRYEKNTRKSTRAEIERQKQEEVAKARVRQVDDKGRAYGTGRRKCSIARVWIQPGDGKFLVNDKQFDVYFPMLDHRAALLQPFSETKTLGLWDINCTVKGGGVSGQVGAIQLGVSRALQNWEPDMRPALRSVGLLTRDPRVVERKKPGKAKARKSFQWVKR